MNTNTFSTRSEAIASITDAIADELVTLHSEETPEGATIASSVHFSIDADEDAFWATVEAHELTA